jgi:signal transduction histidine kinase
MRKHAQTRRVRIVLCRRRDKAHLEVRDHGHGFDPEAASNESRSGEKVGLAEVRERVALLDGELKVTSKPGIGTSLVAEVPLPAAQEETV